MQRRKTQPDAEAHRGRSHKAVPTSRPQAFHTHSGTTPGAVGSLFPDVERARHEAGHAVAYWNMEVTITEVHIIPDDRIGGACFHYLPSGSLEIQFIQNAVGLIAGNAAMRTQNNPTKPSYGWEDDLQNVWAWVRRWLGEDNPRALLFLTDWLIGVTREIMDRPAVAAQVEAVTRALLCSGRLTGDEIDRILEPLPQSRAARQRTEEGIRQAVANVSNKTEAFRRHNLE